MSSHMSEEADTALKLEKQKTKVLKAALKDERKERETIEQHLVQLEQENAQLQQEVQDKEEKYL